MIYKCCERNNTSSKEALVDKINGIGFALFIIMIGGMWLAPKGTLPETTWLVGLGLIIIGVNIVRYVKVIRPSLLKFTLGIIILMVGMSGIIHTTFPIFPVMLIAIGI